MINIPDYWRRIDYGYGNKSLTRSYEGEIDNLIFHVWVIPNLGCELSMQSKDGNRKAKLSVDSIKLADEAIKAIAMIFNQ